MEKISSEELIRLYKLMFDVEKSTIHLELSKLYLDLCIKDLTIKYNLKLGDSLNKEDGSILRKENEIVKSE